MPARALSPAVSENDIDIAGALVNDSDSEPHRHGRSFNRKDAPIPALDGGDDDEDDEEFIALTQAASNRKASNLKGRTVKKGGGFQAMGLNANLLKAITRKGFAVPTPIQRRTIPLLLAGKDVVGMARTGSGKTAAFVIPMIQKLKAHSAQIGARALILSPSRELALQTLKVVKELSRGTDLKAILLVGGDSLEEQFGAMAGNPDIVIATPGRFLHLQVEMRLDLSSIRYVVFDEADRLFEMGFATQLAEILAALPASRQTLLFSATLPKSLVEFAHAGLQDPSLVRLDLESKVSPDLQSAFFSVKSSEKVGALLHLLENVIQMPTGPTGASLRVKEEAKTAGKKRKRGEIHDVNAIDSPTPFSTLVFAATKHHVDYLAYLLRLAGYAVSHVYGSLDQTARRQQVQDFRAGRTHVMVVTDVAARGIDIPILANVINYDFPAQPKVFVHRVGRTARAGKTGWSYSLVADADVPYMLDLQLFLGRRLIVGRSSGEEPSYAADVVVGGFGRDALERCVEGASKMVADDVDLSALRDVAAKGEKLYRRTRPSASAQSAQRAKTAVAERAWSQLHPLFGGAEADLAALREQMLARVSGFRPQETVFEIGRNGQLYDAGEVVRKRREGIVARKQKARGIVMDQADDNGNRTQGNAADESDSASASFSNDVLGAPADLNGTSPPPDAPSDGSLSDLDVTISQRPTGSTTAKDPSVYMSYTPQSGSGDAYAVNSSTPSSFLTTARSLTLDLGGDEGGKGFAEPSRVAHQTKRWDRKAKKYVNTEASTAENGMKRQVKKKGSDGATIVGESGARLSASFRSGRFDEWMKKQRLGRLPRVGEKEDAGVVNRTAGANLGGGPGHRFFHRQAKAPKMPDKKRDDFYKQKKRVEKAKTDRVGRFSEGEGKSEIKGFREVQKERMAKSKRRARNGPGKKSFGKKGRK
jgi:ATP-dependent RNA helicase DDX54/DBP10